MPAAAAGRGRGPRTASGRPAPSGEGSAPGSGGRVEIRVRPGASRTRVGGSYGDRLVVAVGARAVDGAATAAVLRALADALGVRPRQVRLVLGATSRDKVVEVDGVAPEDLLARVDALRRVGL